VDGELVLLVMISIGQGDRFLRLSCALIEGGGGLAVHWLWASSRAALYKEKGSRRGTLSRYCRATGLPQTLALPIWRGAEARHRRPRHRSNCDLFPDLSFTLSLTRTLVIVNLTSPTRRLSTLPLSSYLSVHVYSQCKTLLFIQKQVIHPLICS
jgi:hypothetical protein